MSYKPITWDSIRDHVLADPEVKAEYDALEAEFELASRAIAIRASTGLTQREFAERVGMKQSQIARIESGTQLPKLETLAKLAAVAGYAVEVNFIPLQAKQKQEIKPLRLDVPEVYNSEPLGTTGSRREALTAFLESQDEVAVRVRERLQDKLMDDIATQLEKCLSLPQEDRVIAVKNLLTGGGVLSATRSANEQPPIPNMAETRELLKLARTLVSKVEKFWD